MIIDWYAPTASALIGLWEGFILFLPKFIGALVVFLIGWFIAVGIGKLITEILKKLKLNRVFERGRWREALEKAEIKIDAASFIGGVFKWILVVVFLLAAVEILGLKQFADFLSSILAYLPNVIVAALIFVVAVIIADILEKLVRASIEGMKLGYGKFVGAIVKWSIWIFAILAILYQLKIAPGLIETLVTGIVGLIVIAGGIAFGLGGKELASEALQNIKRRLKE